MWLEWIEFMIGIWLIVCGFIPGLQSSASLVATGIATFLFGFWDAAIANSWQGTINGVLGVWLVLSGMTFHLNSQWNFFIVGSVILILAVWSVAKHPQHGEFHTAH
jgi:hypothetical protein